jgi:hypothetical protein
MNKLDKIIYKIIKEATSDRTGSRGSYIPPIQPGLRSWDKTSLGPYQDPVSDYKSPLVQYDSYDHKWDLRTKQIKDLEKTASKIQNYIKTHPFSTSSDEDGNVINQFMYDGKTAKHSEMLSPFTEKLPFNEWVEINDNVINEITTTVTSGEYSGPQELGLRKWTPEELGGFSVEADHPINKLLLKKTIKKNVLKTLGGWEPRNGKFEVPTGDVDSHKEKRVKSNGEVTIDPIVWYKNFEKRSKLRNDNYIKKSKVNEDLAVWFGTKKKPKGSSQPKGPWVNICRKVDGKHPPCGRSDTSEGGYPKCRAAGVAGKMTDSQKKAACSQKRSAEKKDTQSGKGQKPVMTSYKPKKKN